MPNPIGILYGPGYTTRPTWTDPLPKESNCPKTYGSGNNNLAPLDLQSPTVFDNHYYKTLIKNKGLLQSDEQLFDGGSTNATVRAYSKSYDTFSSDCESHDQDGRYQTPHWISWGD
ncbi:hypothetical protein ACFX13_042318 [Malus domestica]